MKKVLKVILKILTFGIYAVIDNRRQSLRDKFCNILSTCKVCPRANICTMKKEVVDA